MNNPFFDNKNQTFTMKNGKVLKIPSDNTQLKDFIEQLYQDSKIEAYTDLIESINQLEQSTSIDQKAYLALEFLKSQLTDKKETELSQNQIEIIGDIEINNYNLHL